MHRGDDKSWDVLGDETGWKVSSREPDRKENNISKGDHTERGWNGLKSSGYTLDSVADFCNQM
jgi:hypothetical protein